MSHSACTNNPISSAASVSMTPGDAPGKRHDSFNSVQEGLKSMNSMNSNLDVPHRSPSAPVHVDHAPQLPNIPSTDLRRQWILPQFGDRDVHQDYDLARTLGEGAFGTTFLATSRRDGQQYACKSISKRKIATPVEVEDIRREVAILQHLAAHPHIVQLVDVYEDKSNVHMVMELCRGGELFERILAKERYSEADAANTARTIISTVAYCHQRGVLHRDLKPENFLLLDSSEDAAIKLTDFGLSQQWQEGARLSEIAGSPYYLAPEVLRRNYGKEADLWSCGVILYILLSGMPPFYGDSEKRIFESILSSREVDLYSDPWPSVSEGAKDCVRRLLVRDPRQRATAEQILAHPWLQQGGASASPLARDVLDRMKRFTYTNQLKAAALKIVARNLPAAELAQLKDTFKAIDTDGSGTITIDELRAAMNNIGGSLGEAQLQMLMANADADGDGEIDYEEFLVASLNMQKLDREEALRAAFDRFDVDGSGTISKEELLMALTNLGIDDVEEIIEEADKDGNGEIDYYEFCELMRST